MTVLDVSNKKAIVLYQDADKDCDLPEETLIVTVDAGNTLFIQQRDQYIVLNRSSIPTLSKIFKDFQ